MPPLPTRHLAPLLVAAGLAVLLLLLIGPRSAVSRGHAQRQVTTTQRPVTPGRKGGSPGNGRVTPPPARRATPPATPTPAPSSTPAPDTRAIRLRAVNADTGQGISGLVFALQPPEPQDLGPPVLTELVERPAGGSVSNDQGEATLDIPSDGKGRFCTWFQESGEGWCVEDYQDLGTELRGFFRRGRRASGRVVYDDGGAPVVGALVHVSFPANIGMMRPPNSGELERRTESEGRFSFFVPRTAYRISALAANDEGAGQGELRVPPTGDIPDMVIRLKPLATLAGLVHGQGCQPIPGATVTVSQQRFPRMDRYSTTTKPDGTYTLPGVPVLASWVAVSGVDAPGWKTPSIRTLTPEPGWNPGIDFAYEPGEPIDGIITDMAGNPIEGALVHAQAANTGEELGYSSPTDSEGYYHLDSIPAGTVVGTLTATRDGYQPQTHESVRASDRGQNFQLARLGGITIRAVDPVTRANVPGFRWGLGYDGTNTGFTTDDGGTSDLATGIAEPRRVRAGLYRVDVATLEGAPRFGSQTFRVDDIFKPVTVVVEVVAGHRVEGRVTTGPARLPVAGAVITARVPGSGLDLAGMQGGQAPRSGGDGAYHLDFLPEGKVVLQSGLADRPGRETLVTIPPGASTVRQDLEVPEASNW